MPDPERKGIRMVVGRTGVIYPVTVFLSYLVKRGGKSGVLFPWPDGSPLSKYAFVKEVCAALTKVGLPAKGYAEHGFCIGAATTAATVGIQDSAIQILGRWKVLHVNSTSEQVLTSLQKSHGNCPNAPFDKI